jgi:UDP-N-acetylmuramyl pentapeptide phosphotransferase/UDP-N-acetylglucosamine-1-phosphate transferase
VREYILSLLAAAAVTYLLTPLARELALKWRVVASVRDRDVHATPTPLLGGLAMVGGLLAGLILASKLPMMSAVFDGGRTPIALLSGVAIIVALGIIDDKWGLDAPTKLAGQVLAAGVMAFQGIAIIWLPIGGTFVLDPLTSVLFTVLIVVISINAINFVDGLDGLAAGIVLVAAGAFFGYAYLLSVESGLERATLATLVSVLLVGITAGFLPHNYAPARIFMGDTGSMLLGLLLAAATITLSGQVDPSALEHWCAPSDVAADFVADRRHGDTPRGSIPRSDSANQGGAQPVRAGQAAFASSTARDGALAPEGRCADVCVDGASSRHGGRGGVRPVALCGGRLRSWPCSFDLARASSGFNVERW